MAWTEMVSVERNWAGQLSPAGGCWEVASQTVCAPGPETQRPFLSTLSVPAGRRRCVGRCTLKPCPSCALASANVPVLGIRRKQVPRSRCSADRTTEGTVRSRHLGDTRTQFLYVNRELLPIQTPEKCCSPTQNSEAPPSPGVTEQPTPTNPRLSGGRGCLQKKRQEI